MLLDEPFSALDAGLRAATRKAVAELLAAAGITTILVTHDQAEALSFADQVAVMRGGRLSQAGTPRELYLKPRDAMIAAFLGDAIVLPAIADGGIADCALGRLGIDDPTRRGAVEIMLRPGQLSLRADQDGAEGVRGEVTDVDFAGAICTVAVRLFAPGIAPCVTLRRSGLDAPPVGSTVAIAVSGDAHCFPKADLAQG